MRTQVELKAGFRTHGVFLPEAGIRFDIDYVCPRLLTVGSRRAWSAIGNTVFSLLIVSRGAVAVCVTEGLETHTPLGRRGATPASVAGSRVCT